MLKDQALINAKGHVKLELYDEQGNVFFTKEKKNLVVLSANEIVGQVMSDPSKKVRANQTDKGSTELSPGADGTYAFNLSLQPEADGVYTVDMGSSNTNKDVALTGVENITQLKKVTVNGLDLALEDDVYVKDADAGILTFKTAPTNQLRVEYRKVNNPYVEIVPGTEVVKVNGVQWTHAKTPSDSAQTYSIDYKTGKVFFASSKANVEVSYVFKVRYGLAFMGLGGKPDGHPDYKPVEFSNLDKMKVDMDNEFVGCRQLIQYPANISKGDPEVEVIPTQPMKKKEVTETLVAVGTTSTYTLANTGGNPITDLIKVQDITDPANPVDVTSNVVILDANAGKIKFSPNPADGHKYLIDYNIRDGIDYTQYTMSQGPVLELVSVKHQDLTGKVTEYKVVNSGLVLGAGDVYLLNPMKGIVQFTTGIPEGANPLNPPPTPDTPGLLTFEYRVNSGTTVQYVADFPKGVPGPILTDNTESIPLTTGQSSYGLQYAVAKDAATGNFLITSIKKGSTDLVKGTDYDLSADGTQVILKIAVSTGETLNISYKWYKETHDIYQVAMFTDQVAGKMFNISGIGPVTKDKNTGMRITWSVTF
jgi:hypothetical protein